MPLPSEGQENKLGEQNRILMKLEVEPRVKIRMVLSSENLL
jgi:hypothetical protein